MSILRSAIALLSSSFTLFNVESRADQAGFAWNFVQNGTSDIIALEPIIISNTLAISFDRAANDPLQLKNYSSWGALWSMETNTATPLNLVSDTFCASGGFLSNGTMVSVDGRLPNETGVYDRRMGLRIFEPCDDPTDSTCHILEDLENLHLPVVETRWYPSSARIFDGSLVSVDGRLPNETGVYDRRMGLRIFEPCDDPTDSTCHILEDLENLHLPVVETRWYPSSARIFDGSLMIVGGTHLEAPFYNLDPTNSTEFFPRPLKAFEQGVPVNIFPRNVFSLPDGKTLIIANNQTIIYDIEQDEETTLPDIPNGARFSNPFNGTATLLPLCPPDYIPEVLVCGRTNMSDQIPQEQLSSYGIERMFEPRTMTEMVILPNGKVLIINRAQSGYAAIHTVRDPVGNSNVDHLAKELITGSDPNFVIINTTEFYSEFGVEYINPPYMPVDRPQLLNVPKQLYLNRTFTVDVTVPAGLSTGHYTTKLGAKWGSTRKLTINAPPNNRVYPPGPAYIFLTVDNVTSPGVWVMMGDGSSPPVKDQA
ncbi:hypothetical protein AN958_11948 [Leucoagaricus sp. SymC.cos]|nr:hypothetical protein AN958_11948 [Leucoagaricus sp. SymC.cos]